MFRIQALDSAGQIRAAGAGADTQAISDTYNDAWINKLTLNADPPVSALYTIQSSEVQADGHKFLAFTSAIARNEEIGFRDSSSSAAGTRKLTSLIALDRKYCVALKDAGQKVLAREDALVSQETPSSWLMTPNIRNSPTRMRHSCEKDRMHLCAHSSESRADDEESRGALEDAVKISRGAVLDANLFIRFDYSSYARGYSGREDWRTQFENRYNYMRKWILDGGVEVYYPDAGAGEHLLFNRRNALERMITIDTTPIDDFCFS